MEIKKISDNISVGPQIVPEDIAQLVKRGFKSIICNRPDGESTEQPLYEDVQKAAILAGLEIKYIPISPGGFNQHDIDLFSEKLDTLPAPVFAYCRTGTRSTALWSLSQAAKGTPLAEILEHTEQAGYDMSGLAPLIKERAIAKPAT